MKLLIVNFWDPENTKIYGRYSDAIDILVRSLEDVEVFSIVVSKEADEPLKEKIAGLKRAVEHAIKNVFDRILVLGQSVVLSPGDFDKMAKSDSEIVLTKKGDFSCCLIRVGLLSVFPIAYTGEFTPPDKMWLKFLRQNDIKISIISSVKPVYLN